MNRATGLLVIEVLNSNPNGNPDQDSDPRLRPDERGMISPVSFKRKLRDLLEDKEGPMWAHVVRGFDPHPASDEFQILETRGRDRNEIKSIDDTEFVRRYWDGRVFGNTFLEKEAAEKLRTGVVQFGMGVSICPLEIERMTNTNKAGVEAGTDRGMAPLAYRIVLHGVYVMPYFVNPSVAKKSGCTVQDIQVMTRLIPYAYSNTASYVRPMVTIRHAWHIEHQTPLGSCPDHLLIGELTPRRHDVNANETPSRSWDEYEVPKSLPEDLKDRIRSCSDLVTQQWNP